MCRHCFAAVLPPDSPTCSKVPGVGVGGGVRPAGVGRHARHAGQLQILHGRGYFVEVIHVHEYKT